MNDHSPQPHNRALKTGVGVLIGLLVLTSVAAVAFLAGRASAETPDPVVEVETVTETVTEQVEVTREVVLEVTAEAPEPLPTPERAFDPTEMGFETFDEAWRIINNEFDGELPAEEELMYGAISGSIETLGDDYTRFVEPDLAERLRQDLGGSVSGIGAFVQENDNGLFEIVRPIDGQPADLVGLMPGDIVTEINGESVLEMSFDEVILLVRGPEGTSVTLTIAREGEAEPLTFEIVRTTFEVPTVEYEMLGSAEAPIAYIQLTEFNRNATPKLEEALAALLPQQPVGLIFDLRDNPGGYLDQAVNVADLFLTESPILFERNIRGLDEVFTAETDGTLSETIPMVVLINAGSASASEIVAGAIQDLGRGTLIGETSFGKGSVQQIHTLSDGSELRVTIARWYTPSNNTISGEGITPDIEIETPPDLGEEDDPQIQRALDFLTTGQ